LQKTRTKYQINNNKQEPNNKQITNDKHQIST